jgi:hypothetical protein
MNSDETRGHYVSEISQAQESQILHFALKLGK